MLTDAVRHRTERVTTVEIRTTSTARWRRGQLTDFVERHRLPWETMMALLTVLYVFMGLRAEDSSSQGLTLPVLGLTALFVMEFALRLWDAPNRGAYARQHWFDLVACVPLVGVLRGFRLLRLLRLAASFRMLATVQDVGAIRHKRRDSLDVLIPAVIVVWLGAAQVIWDLEHGVNPHLHNYLDALYWAITATTTIGYGDIVPVTPAGRLLSSMLAFVGIGLVGYVSSRLTAAWLREGASDEADTRLAHIEAELREIKELLTRH